MWKIQHIVVFVICTVTGFLFFPISLIFSVLCVVLTGLVYFCGLPLSVHVASIRLWIESSYASAVNLFHQSNQTLSSQHRQLHSNGIVKNHSLIFTDKRRSSPNLISRNPLCNEQKLPDSFIMPLNNCSLHSTPLGLSKNEFDKQRKRLNEVEERCSPSWCDKDREVAFSPKSVPRNVQSVAGPLLVSTRFNTSLNAELTADVSSMGFSSRVAQKGSVRDGVTHQPKYSGVGVFPLVQLNSRSPKHSLSPRNCNAASKAVRVRIAPPDNGPFGGLENTILSTSTNGDESMKSVLQVLKEMSRKRIHSQVDEEEDDKVKRQKKENYDENTPKVCLDGGLQNKRGRDDSPRSSEEVKRQRRLTNATAGSNEIMSSLSSSLAVKPPHLMKGTKRKAHAVDWSRSTTPVSGKLLKVNVSPVTRISPPTSTALIEEEQSGQKSFKDTDNEIAISNKQVEENEQKQSSTKTLSVEKNNAVAVEPSSECVRIEAGKRRVLARTGDLKEVPVQDIRWQESDTDTGGYVDESTPTISVQKIKDPGRRLKDMLAAIDGSDEIDADPTSMSPSVIAILKTAKPSSKQKSTSILNSPDTLHSPKSILRTIGKHESHKTVTFADEVNVENKNTAAVDLGSTSPQTCLTTATIVSNSINTSISSASETTSFQFGGSSSTYKNADSNLTFSASSPSTAISPVSTASATTVASTPQQESQTKSPFGSVTAVFGATETKSAPPINFFNTASPISTASNTGKVSDSLAVSLGNNNSGTSTGFNFGTGIKSNEGLSSNPSAASGLLGVNSEQNKPTPGLFGFSSVANVISPSNSSSLSIAPVSVGSSTNNTFALNPSTQPFDLNASKLPSTSVATNVSSGENAQKPQFGMFNFGNSQSNNSNDNKSSGSIFGGLGSPSTIAPAASQSSSTMSQSTAPSFMMPSTTTAAASNSLFSFGANSASSNQAPNIFGSASSQAVTQQSLFGGTAGNTALQTAATTITSVSSSTQPNIFNNVNANTQLTVFGGSATQPNLSSPAVTNAVAVNSAPVFGNVQPAISSTGTTPTFGSGGLFNGIPNKTEGFGSAGVFGSSTVPASGVDSTPSLFNSFSSPAQSGSFGSKPSATVNAFSTNPVVTAPTPVFGQQASTSGSLFQFNSSPAQTTTSSLFGNNSNPVTAAASVNGPSTFGVFSKANNSTSDADKAKSSPFGGSVSTSGSSFQPGVFSFGSSALSSNSNFGFGNATNTAATTTASSVFNSPFKPPTNEPKPFGFDTAPQPAIQSQAPVFAFGQSNNNSNSSQPAAPSFQFNANNNNNNNATQQPASSGIFSFGAATNSPFGSGINPPTFNIGGGEAPSGSAMFSIGSGSSSARPRTAARPRRTK